MRTCYSLCAVQLRKVSYIAGRLLGNREHSLEHLQLSVNKQQQTAHPVKAAAITIPHQATVWDVQVVDICKDLATDLRAFPQKVGYILSLTQWTSAVCHLLQQKILHELIIFFF